MESKLYFPKVFNEAEMVEDIPSLRTIFLTIEIMKKVVYFFL